MDEPSRDMNIEATVEHNYGYHHLYIKSNSFKRFMESIGSPIPGYEYKSRLRKEGAG